MPAGRFAPLRTLRETYFAFFAKTFATLRGAFFMGTLYKKIENEINK